MACPLCTAMLERNAELLETNALLAQMLRELLDEVEVTLESAGIDESPDPVRQGS